jgi:hypothetical protein
MRFNRFFGSGYKSTRSDPLEKIFAEFVCDLCGETNDIDVSSTMNTFDPTRERRCPSCKQINASDRENNLKAALEKLTSDKNRIQIEIEKIEREINQLKEVIKE